MRVGAHASEAFPLRGKALEDRRRDARFGSIDCLDSLGLREKLRDPDRELGGIGVPGVLLAKVLEKERP